MKKERLDAQKNVDTAILNNIKGNKNEPLLKRYLAARFTLGNNEKPHEMAF